ncbi:MAG: glycosyltransferase family 2 protein [Acidobacteriota bacterium]
MDISVITVTFNRQDDLRRALRSVMRQTGVAFEVIVADNGSTDGTPQMLQDEFPAVRVLPMGANTGMRAHNAGICAARADILFFLDNDMVLVEDDLLARVYSYFTNDSQLGAAACRVWDVVRDRTGVSLRLSGNSPKHIAEGDARGGYETSAFDGGGAGFRRSAVLEADMFCEEFFLYHGEVDLTVRLLDCGWAVRFFPHVSVIHCHSPVERSSDLYSFLATRNYFWYLYRNYPVRSMFVEGLRYLVQSGEQALIGRRRRLAWAHGVLSGMLGVHRVPERRPVRREIIRRQQEIRIADRLRKERTGEMKELRRLTRDEVARYGL